MNLSLQMTGIKGIGNGNKGINLIPLFRTGCNYYIDHID